MNKKIAFNYLGNYHIPLKYLINNVTDCEIINVPHITQKTIELGIKYSPEFVCIPFKYNLGNFIEALDKGANVLIEINSGCCKYYNEVQKQILNDLGYEFEFYSLTDKSIYKILKKLNNKLNLFKYLYYYIITLLMIYYMDKIDIYIRGNIGFEVRENSFEILFNKMLNDFSNTKNIFKLIILYFKYKKLFKNIEVNKPTKLIKIGIIGELYLCMESFSNYDLEKLLGRLNVEITRYNNGNNLLIKKRFNHKKILKKILKYCKYNIGDEAINNIYKAIGYAEKGYDGLIYIKPYLCTSLIGSMHILNKVIEDINIPIFYITFDDKTSIEDLKTSLEEFYI